MKLLRYNDHTMGVDSTNPRKDEYIKYIRNHVDNVIFAWENIVKPYIMSDEFPIYVTDDELKHAESNISYHDMSKFDKAEFYAYCDYFYPLDEVTEDMEEQFDYAWNHHQKHNPHHWQYWILQRDSGEEKRLDIPMEYILEMICDWMSFTSNPDSDTTSDWYFSNISNIHISYETRSIVEQILFGVGEIRIWDLR